MSTLNFQTKIRIIHNWSNNYRYLYLKDSSFILYGKFTIILFHKNLNWEELTPFKEKYSSNITSMRKNKDGNILCCNQDLYIITIKSKITNLKHINIRKLLNKDEIFDAIEIYDNTILGITKNYILNIIIKDENIDITKLYDIQKYYIKKEEGDLDFNSNLYIYELQNNNILIHSYSFGIYDCSSECVEREYKFYKNKIFIFNFKYRYIKDFIEDNQKINITTLKKYICIIFNYKDISIYDINNYNLLKTIKVSICSTIKYNDNIILIIGGRARNKIILYDLSDINNIKYQLFIPMDYIKDEIYTYSYLKDEIGIFRFNEKKILIVFPDSLFIFELPRIVDSLPLNILRCQL